MAELFNRYASLDIGTDPTSAVRVTGLRIQFKIEKKDLDTPSHAEIKVWNLARSTREKIVAQKSAPVVLTAGYEGHTSVLFQGDILQRGMNIARAGADWVTSFKVGDGLLSYQTDHVSITIPKATSVRDAMAMIAQSFKGIDAKAFISDLRSGKVALPGKMQQFLNGTAVSGRPMDELAKFLRAHKLKATVVDGKLEVSPIDPTAASALWPTDQVPDLTSSTGLIGSPEPARDGMTKLRCLLRPEIKPNRLVHVVWGAHPKGIYLRAQKVEHIGDTRGQEWYTDVEGTKQ